MLTRPGPVPVRGDTWDGPDSAAPARRRRRAWSHHVWVVLILAATAAVPATVLPRLASVSEPAVGERGNAGLAPVWTAPVVPSVPGAGIVTAPPAPESKITAALSTGSATLPARPAALTLVYEAENAEWSTSGVKAMTPLPGASGNSGARFHRSSGWIEVRDVAVPAAGVYLVTIFYAPAGFSRTGVVSSGGQSVGVTFLKGDGCCTAVSVSLALSPGGTVRIAPTGWSGGRPVIDRVVIGQR